MPCLFFLLIFSSLLNYSTFIYLNVRNQLTNLVQSPPTFIVAKYHVQLIPQWLRVSKSIWNNSSRKNTMSHRSGIEVTEDIKNEMARARKGDVRVLQVIFTTLYCIDKNLDYYRKWMSKSWCMLGPKKDVAGRFWCTARSSYRIKQMFLRLLSTWFKIIARLRVHSFFLHFRNCCSPR